MSNSSDDSRIAVVGMAGRFPGAGSVEELWCNLREGREAVRFLSEEELRERGADAALLDDPCHVRAVSEIADADCFDAPFFGFSPREAEILDPQQRVFLECSWQALENAGYDPSASGETTGLFAGATTSTYLLFHLLARSAESRWDPLQLLMGNAADTLATRVAYKLNLRGPAFTVQCACSTSLVAVHLAVESLLTEACDMALAGGVSINVAQRTGYRYQEGSILSPDGHCRAFDEKAQGTVFGSGVAVVVLKRLQDALADGDPIRAVILGSAVNNDGSQKVGYTAPGVEGQARVISEALAVAGVEAETISYVEAHGTGTSLGDPIEVEALTRAFGAETDARGFCGLGSLKSNVGHLDVAAGVAGLVKTVLALEHREIPPSLHFAEPNPKIDFAASPVEVVRELRPWEPPAGAPRRAGVSSFGIGGTNAHVVLEEAPEREPGGPSRPWQLLVLSAKTRPALDRATANLGEHLDAHPDLALADVAWTLAAGRRAFGHRRIVVCRDPADAAAALAGRDEGRLRSHAGLQEPWKRPVVFMFSGQGAQHVGMGRGLYEDEPAFRQEVDRAAEQLRPQLDCDLREILFPPAGREEEARQRLTSTAVAQPALFAVEYALAVLWRELGVEPAAMIGHSVGEYVAAALAGVFSPEDALALVAARGALMQEMPAGEMLAVPLAEDEVAPLVTGELALAAVNAARLCVVSGPPSAVDELGRRLGERGVEGRRLHTSHAFHSPMMEPILDRFTAEVCKVELRSPRLPFVSNLSGALVTAAEATDPSYWARHLRGTVRFADGVDALAGEGEPIFLEVGPGRSLTTLVRQTSNDLTAVASMRHPRDTEVEDPAALLEALGRLWLHGRRLDPQRLFAGRRRVALPPYSFERHRYWIERRATVAPEARPTMTASGGQDPADGTEAGGVAEPPASLHARPELETDYVAPRNETEEKIAALWQELLGVEKIGVHDSFLDLGGHSLLATQLASRLRETFAVEIPLEYLFSGNTVARLAKNVETVLWVAGQAPDSTPAENLEEGEI